MSLMMKINMTVTIMSVMITAMNPPKMTRLELETDTILTPRDFTDDGKHALKMAPGENNRCTEKMPPGKNASRKNCLLEKMPPGKNASQLFSD